MPRPATSLTVIAIGEQYGCAGGGAAGGWRRVEGSYYQTNGAFSYLSAGETALDTFTYTISDGHGGTAASTVTVTVTGVNQAPGGHRR